MPKIRVNSLCSREESPSAMCPNFGIASTCISIRRTSGLSMQSWSCLGMREVKILWTKKVSACGKNFRRAGSRGIVIWIRATRNSSSLCPNTISSKSYRPKFCNKCKPSTLKDSSCNSNSNNTRVVVYWFRKIISPNSLNSLNSNRFNSNQLWPSSRVSRTHP